MAFDKALVLAVERAYVTAATGGQAPTSSAPALLARARAATYAIASRYLAVGTPRTLGLVVDDGSIDEAIDCLDAHRIWFSPRELRCAGITCDPTELASRVGGTAVPIGEALASDIVCVHGDLAIAAAQLRRGTHVNVRAASQLDDDLMRLATVIHDGGRGAATLGALAAGIEDGRQLDELTVFVAGASELAMAALTA